MTLFVSLIVCAILVDLIRRRVAWLLPTLATYVGNAGIAVAIGAVEALNWLWGFLELMLWAILGYVLLLTIAVIVQYEPFTFAVVMAGALPAFLAMYALHLLRLPLAQASKKLTELGTWVDQIPASFQVPDSITGFWRVLASIPLIAVNAIYLPLALPTKATGRLIKFIGTILWFADELARKLARGLAMVTMTLLFLAVMSLVDIWFGWHIVDPWVLGFATLALMIYLVLGVLGKEVPTLVRTMAQLSTVGLVAMIISRYSSYVGGATKTATWNWTWEIWEMTPQGHWFFAALALLAIYLVLPKDQKAKEGE